jgi:hypothetical protein
MKTALLAAFFLSLAAPFAQADSAVGADADLPARIVAREHQIALALDGFHPLVETYVQVLRGEAGEAAPWYDRHFLSVAEFQGGLRALRFKPRNAEIWRDVSEYADSFSPVALEYMPSGFVAMAYPDPGTFDLYHYRFQYAGVEILGGTRCLVFDVRPATRHKKGLFEGRIWAEEQDLTIVRFKGIYDGSNISSKYLHFDSWRANPKGDLWVPSVIYSEETGLPCCGVWKLNWTKIRFRAETRFWGYGLHLLEPGNDSVEAPQLDLSSRLVSSSFRAGEPVVTTPQPGRKSEGEVVQGLEHVGLLSPSGEIEEGLQKIIESIESENHLSFRQEVRCRVLLTSNLESAAVGHTIVVSRGLLEVLPDEAVLAAVLAHGMAHVLSAESENGNASMTERPVSDPREVARRIRFEHTQAEETRASLLAREWMQHIPYGSGSESVTEFARELKEHSGQIANLLKPLLGESVCQILEAGQPDARSSSRSARGIPSSLAIARSVTIDPWSDRLNVSRPLQRQASPASDTVALEIASAVEQFHRMSSTNP